MSASHKTHQSREEEALRREVERLKGQLEKQEKHFEAILKDKYKQLNAIEDKMIERQKKYEELAQQLHQQTTQKLSHAPQPHPKLAYESQLVQSLTGSTVSASEEQTISLTKIQLSPQTPSNPSQTTHLKEKIKELTLQLEQKNQIIAKNTDSLTSAEREVRELKAQLSQAKKKTILPLTNHVIKSYYQYDMVQSLIGSTLTKEGQQNLMINTYIMQEQSPKLKENALKGQSSSSPISKEGIKKSKVQTTVHPSQTKRTQKQQKKEPSPILKELSLQNNKLSERLKDLTASELLLRKEIRSLKKQLAELKGQVYIETEIQKRETKPIPKNTINESTPSKPQRESKNKGAEVQSQQKKESPQGKPSWIKQSTKNNNVPVWVKVREQEDDDNIKREVQSPMLVKKESGLVKEMRKMFEKGINEDDRNK